MNLNEVISGVVKNKLKKYTNTQEDDEAIAHAYTLIKDYQVKSVIVEGNFTVVMIGDSNGHVFTGVAKRNPKDGFNAIRGERLAASRAVHKAIDTFS